MCCIVISIIPYLFTEQCALEYDMNADSNVIEIRSDDSNPVSYVFGALDGSHNVYIANPSLDKTTIDIGILTEATINTVSFWTENVISSKLTVINLDGAFIERVRLQI